MSLTCLFRWKAFESLSLLYICRKCGDENGHLHFNGSTHRDLATLYFYNKLRPEPILLEKIGSRLDGRETYIFCQIQNDSMKNNTHLQKIENSKQNQVVISY